MDQLYTIYKQELTSKLFRDLQNCMSFLNARNSKIVCSIDTTIVTAEKVLANNKNFQQKKITKTNVEATALNEDGGC